MPTVWIIVGFHVLIGVIFAIDLGIHRRGRSAMGLTEAAAWSAVWVVLAVAFAAAIWRWWTVCVPDSETPGGVHAIQFLTGYLVEKALSVDNLFVFLVVFRYFSVPAYLQRKVLVWGILGALILRASLLLAGAALLTVFFWMNYVFGAFLLVTAWKLARTNDQPIDPERNVVLRVARRVLPIAGDSGTPNFFLRHEGHWRATPLILVLLVIETTDLIFALDSIPAILGITQNVFIAYTSNVMAILGLRALYFLLAGLLGLFRYLNVGLALVLAFVGLKMIFEQAAHRYLEDHGATEHIRTLGSLAVILVILSGAIIASLVHRKPA